MFCTVYQTVNMAVELRKPVYWSVSLRVIPYDTVLQQIGAVRWDVKEIMSQHNTYVDFLIKVRVKEINIDSIGLICKKS